MNSKKAQKVWRELFGWKIGDKCRVPFGYSGGKQNYLHAVITNITLTNSHAFVEIECNERPERSGLVYKIEHLREDEGDDPN